MDVHNKRLCQLCCSYKVLKCYPKSVRLCTCTCMLSSVIIMWCSKYMYTCYMYVCTSINLFTYVYRSVPGKHPWALKHNSRFWTAWALTRDQTSICLYRSCYSGPFKCGTWALTREWALAQDTTVCTYMYSYCIIT